MKHKYAHISKSLNTPTSVIPIIPAMAYKTAPVIEPPFDALQQTVTIPAINIKIATIAQSENVSLNSFVIQCCEYALDNLEETNKKKEKEM